MSKTNDTGNGAEAIVDLRGTEFNVRGEKIMVVPIVIGQIPGLLKAVKSLAPLFSSAPPSADMLTSMMDTDADAVIDIIAVALNKPRAWVNQVPPDEFIELAGAVLEVNVDFFMKRVLPALRDAMKRLPESLAQKMAGAGMTASSN